MLYKLLSRNASFALIVLFATISLFPIGLSADHHGDHDNISIHGVSAQTMAGPSYYHPYVYSMGYANIDNYSGNFTVRYYYSSQLAVYRKGSQIPFALVPDSDAGWVDPGDWLSFFADFSIDMTGARAGEYTARDKAELDLKFDFNGDNWWDDGRSVSSSAWLDFEIK